VNAVSEHGRSFIAEVLDIHKEIQSTRLVMVIPEEGTPTTSFTHFLAPGMVETLELLQEEGFIETVQGMGSQVSRQANFDFPVSQLTSYQEIVKASVLHSETNIIRLEKISIDEKGTKKTGFPLHRLVWKVTRQRVVDGVSSVLDIDYLDRELIPGLTKEIAQHSIYQYIEEDLELQISYAKKEILISPIDNRDKILLDLGKDKHVVTVRSQVHLADGRQFQFTESRHILDKFHFVDYAERRK